MKKNVASQSIGAQLIAKADGTPVTTGTTTVYVTGDNGTQAAGSVGSGACTHEGNGYWSYAPAQAETNYDHIAFTFVNTNAINATVQVFTQFPQTGDAYAVVNSGTHGNAALKTLIDDVEGKVDDLETRLGTPSDLGSGASVAANLVDIESLADNLPASFPTNFASLAIGADGRVEGNVKEVNDVAITGAGVPVIDPWRPA